jgi:hypothetical protein
MNIPGLDVAFKSVASYHRQVVSEAVAVDLQGLQVDFERGYREEVAEATRVYRSAVRDQYKAWFGKRRFSDFVCSRLIAHRLGDASFTSIRLLPIDVPGFKPTSWS